MKTKRIIFIIPALVIPFLISGCYGSYETREQRFFRLKYSGEYEQIIEENLRCLEEARRENKRAPQVQSARYLCETYQKNIKEYSKAIKYGELALQLIEEALRLGPENEPNENFDITFTYKGKSLYDKEQVKELKIGWYKGQKGFVSRSISLAYKALGDSKKASFYKKQAKESVEILDPVEVVKKQIEKYDKKIEELRKEKAAAKKYGKKKAATQLLILYESMRDTMEKSTEKSKKQLALLSRVQEQAARGDQDGLRASLKECTSMLYESDQYDSVRSMPWGPAYINSLICPGMADVAHEFGLFQEAYDYCTKALDSQEKYLQSVSAPEYRLDPRMIAAARTEYYIKNGPLWLTAGKSLNRLGRYSEAIEYLKKSYGVKKEVERTFSNLLHSAVKMDREKMPRKMEVLYELAYIYEKAGMKQEAVNALVEMIDCFEGLRARLTKETQKVSFMGTQNETYNRIIDLFVREGRLGEALEYVEKSRSRAFVDLLGEKELRPKTERARDLLAKKSAIQKKLASIQEQGAEDASRERSIKVVQKEMDRVLKEIEKEDAELLSMTTARTLKASEIQALLDSDTALVEYHVTQDEVSIWVATNDSINVKKVDIPIWVLAKKVAGFRENVSKPDGEAGTEELIYEPSRVRLEITSERFKNGDVYTMRTYVKNNMSLLLTIDRVASKVGEYVYSLTTSKDLFEREIPSGEEKLTSEISDTMTKWKIIPGIYQFILHTDQGELASNLVEVVIDEEGMVTVKDKGYAEDDESVRSGMERYAGMSLYDILIKPVKPYLKKRRLAIIPHGTLHYLPFAAIKHNGRYLIEDYALVYLPSATVYKFCQNKIKDLGGSILAIGNPDLGKPQLDIPFALKEVDAISRLYPDSNILVRADASEGAFKSFAGSYNVLHLACHGIFDADKPLNSALLLSRVGEEDGRLTVSEIFDLELDAGLVTLSACQSGMSRIKAGDELMGLPRAFIYAGVPSVVASLWNVNDEATALLMEEFYKNLKGSDKGDALRTAQLKLLKEKVHKKPYYWAAFYLIGDYR